MRLEERVERAGLAVGVVTFGAHSGIANSPISMHQRSPDTAEAQAADAPNPCNWPPRSGMQSKIHINQYVGRDFTILYGS